jgi:hypothetical protein
MKYLELTDLYNPEKYTGILLTNGNYVEAEENQGFQYYEKNNRITLMELWQKLPDGRLLKVKGWYSKSIIAYY